MTRDAIGGLIRHLLTFGSGWLVGQGWLTETGAQQVGVIGMGIFGLVWSILQKRGIVKEDRKKVLGFLCVLLVLLAGCASHDADKEPMELTRTTYDASGGVSSKTEVRFTQGWYGEGCGVWSVGLVEGSADGLIQQNAATDYIGARILPQVLHEIMVPITAIAGVPMELINVLAGRPAPEPIPRTAEPGCQTVIE